MDNLPKDPPNDNNPPPPFGTNFNPHTNPVDPNNPYASQPPQNPVPEDGIKHANYSEVAQHKLRDEHGRFIPDHDNQNPPPISQITTPPSPSNPSPSSNPPTPLPITISENTKYSGKIDPPLFNIFVIFTNPVTYLKNFLSRFLKNQDIDLRLKIKPFATIGLVLAFGMVGGTAFSIGRYLFPNSSPIFHRQVVYQGVVQKSDTGQYLLASSDNTLWKLKSKNNNINLSNLAGKQVVVTGNLTSEVYLIEVSEVIIADTQPQSQNPTSPTSQTSPNNPDLSNPAPNGAGLPKLYSGLTWEKTERKVLLFTSGKRRIEQEGVYLESAQVTDYPQAFMDYYTQELQNTGFKQTLNSSEPSGTTITYSKDDLFLTFGVKNEYSGSGDNKKIVGYKAFIEHN